MKVSNARSKFTYLIFVSPAVIVFAIFILIPFVNALLYSFQDWNGISKEVHWIGLSNYAKLAEDVSFWKSFGFTFRFVLITTIIVNLFGLLLALALNMAL